MNKYPKSINKNSHILIKNIQLLCLRSIFWEKYNSYTFVFFFPPSCLFILVGFMISFDKAILFRSSRLRRTSKNVKKSFIVRGQLTLKYILYSLLFSHPSQLWLYFKKENGSMFKRVELEILSGSSMWDVPFFLRYKHKRLSNSPLRYRNLKQFPTEGMHESWQLE